jgi:radical SAM enzyme (TIGR01210 family)
MHNHGFALILEGRGESMRRTPSENWAQTPEALWKEEDILENERVRAMVLILRTSGCWWSKKKGCLMCGYNSASDSSIGLSDIMAQLKVAVGRYEDEKFVKVYTSGSFLDRNEVPLEARMAVMEAFPSAKRILFESRPEFVTTDELSTLPADLVHVALGLESANDEVLRKCLVEDYVRAASLLNEKEIPVRTYLLLKPPFLTERQAMLDTIKSIEFAAPYSESISINPINVQKDTMVEKLWRRGDYRPPWLFSLVEVLKAGKALTEKRVFSSPSGAGSLRGVHNCEKCDASFIEAVKRHSFSQNVKEFDNLECECRARWQTDLSLQDLMRTSVDVERHLADELLFD